MDTISIYWHDFVLNYGDKVAFVFGAVILPIAAAVLIFAAIMMMYDNRQERKRLIAEEQLKPREDAWLDTQMKKRQTGAFSYRRIEEMLYSTGEMYRVKSKGKIPPRPSDYIRDCCIIAVIGTVVTVAAVIVFYGSFNPFLLLTAIPAALVFFNFNRFVMASSDKSDNVKMLPDINSMYEALKVSATAGVPMIDGLTECYRQVKHPRLKKAMAEVSNSIHGGRDMEQTIANLRKQFTSPEITQFCIVVSQSLVTGRQEEILTDLAANMRDVQNEINHKIEENLNTKVQMIQMGLLFVLIFVMLYATFSTLMQQFGSLQ